MNIFKKSYGNILRATGNTLNFLLNALIAITEVIVSLTLTVGRGLLGLLGIGGCLIIFFFLGPLGFIILLHPAIITPILFLVLVPILGTKLISYLKYIKYMVTEFLFDRADYLIDGKKNEFSSFNEYGNKYKKMEEEKRRRERERRQAQQQREWEERFRQWNQQGQYYQGGSSGYQQGYANPAIDFKAKYEASCDLLGIGYNTDKYEAKLAYRKKAKEYHPDVNHSSNATEMFQKVNDAYEFLSDDNINRYKNMN